jgi:hypothetical protein
MLTFEEAPWIEYLEIDEETRQRRLRDDTPEEIRRKYEAYYNKQIQQSDEMRPK